MKKHVAAIIDRLAPPRLHCGILRSGILPSGVESLKVFIGSLIGEIFPRDAGQGYAVGRFISAVAVVRVNVNIAVARTRVISAKVEEGRAAEAASEPPVAPGPCLAVIARPGELRIAGVADEGVQDTIDHQ